MLPIKMPPHLRQRFKVRAAEQNLTYARLIERWLDEEDAKLERQRRAQVHPLHQPGPKSAYPGGGHAAVSASVPPSQAGAAGGGGGGRAHPAFVPRDGGGAGGGGVL